MIPQIIYIIVASANLVIDRYRHGKVDERPYNAYFGVFAMLLEVALLYWGGFFDPLLKCL